MARNYNDDQKIADGRHWGTYSATTELPCASSGVRELALMAGDIAAVNGQLYTCTSIGATGTATWDPVLGAGVTVPSAGIAPIAAPHGFSNWQPVAATSGTDTTPATGTQFVSSLFVPCNKTITSVNYLIGTVGGTDKVYCVIYSATGAVLANTDITSAGTAVTVGTAANIQAIPLTATYASKGPQLFFVGVSMNGNTARLRTVPPHTQAGLLAGSVSQTHGTVAAITVPATFTADKAPVLFLL